MDGKDGLQLLPGTKKRLGIKIPGENRFLYTGSAVLGAVLVSMFVLQNYITSLKTKVMDINDQITGVEQKRNKKDENELRSLKDHLITTSTLIKQHRYWTQLFTWFASTLEGQVQIRSLNVSTAGKITVSAIAANYTVVAKQIAAFLTDDKITDFNVSKLTAASNGSVEFGIEMKVDLSKLIYK